MTEISKATAEGDAFFNGHAFRADIYADVFCNVLSGRTEFWDAGLYGHVWPVLDAVKTACADPDMTDAERWVAVEAAIRQEARHYAHNVAERA